MTILTKPCPCGSNKSYPECCAPYLLGKQLPENPEALMRSRYTAYTQIDTDYIQQTMQGAALVDFNPMKTQEWAAQIQWLGLKILAAPPVSADSNIGFVEFVSSFLQGTRTQTIHELSEFHRIDGRWFYVNDRKPTIKRNDPCPCGSGKKFKHCCQT